MSGHASLVSKLRAYDIVLISLPHTHMLTYTHTRALTHTHTHTHTRTHTHPHTGPGKHECRSRGPLHETREDRKGIFWRSLQRVSQMSCPLEGGREHCPCPFQAAKCVTVYQQNKTRETKLPLFHSFLGHNVLQ